MDLNLNQKERYSRHLAIKEIGEEGQKKLLDASVLVVGAGGLGSPAAMYLASAGVGTIGIVDNDEVDLSNLQRQIVHLTSDLGKAKAESAKETLTAMNPDVCVKAYQTRLTSENILPIISEYDFILDCTDNFPTKFLINDACVMAKKPYCHAGVIRFEGQVMTYVPDKSPCYRCIFKNPPPNDTVPNCKQEGIIGAVCGVVGSIQAAEAVKYILGIGDLLTGCILTVDLLNGKFRTVSLPTAANDCEVCGNG